MATTTYNITKNEGEETSVTVFVGAEQFVATKDHRNFRRILDYLRSGGEDTTQIRNLFDLSSAIAGRFQHLSERVAVGNGKVYFDMDPVDNSITEAILRFHEAEVGDFNPLVRFMEKVNQNPLAHSREQLFTWLEKHDFALAEDGDFIAYKGVHGSKPDELESVTSGRAVVNGVPYNGKIPNQPGTVVEMPRSAVVHQPSVACSTGLHAGNWRYASGFAKTVLAVKINPRDVVSVPSDSNNEKLRVCRYLVLDVVTKPLDDLLYLKQFRMAPVKPKVEEPKAEAPKRGRGRKAQPVVEKAESGRRRGKAAAKPEPEVIAYPEYYEEFTAAQFETLSIDELRFVAREWEVTVPKPHTKENYGKVLRKEGNRRRRTWKK